MAIRPGWRERFEDRFYLFLQDRSRTRLENRWHEHPEYLSLGSTAGHVMFHRTKLKADTFLNGFTTSVALGSYSGSRPSTGRDEFVVLAVDDLATHTRLVNITYGADEAQQLADLFGAAAQRLTNNG